MAAKRNEKRRAEQEKNLQFSKNWYKDKRWRGNGISIKNPREIQADLKEKPRFYLTGKKSEKRDGRKTKWMLIRGKKLLNKIEAMEKEIDKKEKRRRRNTGKWKSRTGKQSAVLQKLVQRKTKTRKWNQYWKTWRNSCKSKRKTNVLPEKWKIWEKGWKKKKPSFIKWKKTAE